jgi:hypothetical protein
MLERSLYLASRTMILLYARLMLRLGIAGTRCVSYVYVRGKYAVTVGEPVQYEGGTEDRAHVTAVADHMMAQIISLSSHSERRATAVIPS